jgi:hypothetical protein
VLDQLNAVPNIYVISTCAGHADRPGGPSLTFLLPRPLLPALAWPFLDDPQMILTIGTEESRAPHIMWCRLNSALALPDSPGWFHATARKVVALAHAHAMTTSQLTLADALPGSRPYDGDPRPDGEYYAPRLLF